MKTNFSFTTNETFTTRDGRIVRYEDIFEGIGKNVRYYGAHGGKDMSKEDLEDIFQDSALRVVASHENFDLDKCHGVPQAYGIQVANFRERDAFIRAQKFRNTFEPLVKADKDGKEYEPQRILGSSGDEYEPDSQIESKEAQSYIWDKIDSLSEKYRRVLALAADGHKPREMAKILGCDSQQVSMILFRARKALKKALGPDFLRRYGCCA